MERGQFSLAQGFATARGVVLSISHPSRKADGSLLLRVGSTHDRVCGEDTQS